MLVRRNLPRIGPVALPRGPSEANCCYVTFDMGQVAQSDSNGSLNEEMTRLLGRTPVCHTGLFAAGECSLKNSPGLWSWTDFVVFVANERFYGMIACGANGPFS